MTLKIARIQEIVAAHHNMKRSRLLEKTHARPVAHPRQIAMALCREFTAASYSQIARAFGGYDHATVMYACEVAPGYPEHAALQQQIRAEIYEAAWLAQ